VCLGKGPGVNRIYVPVCKGSTIPLMNLTIAMAQLNLVDWISAAPIVGSKSADKSE